MNPNTIMETLKQHGGNKSRAAQALGIPRSTLCHTLLKHGANSDQGSLHPQKMPSAPGTRFILTLAQNDTKIHKEFWTNLLAFANQQNAKILVRKQYYNNTIGSPLTRQNLKEKPAPVWAPEITPYLCEHNTRLHKSLVFMSGVNTNMTAVNPLSGFHLEPPEADGIYASPRIALTTIPTANNQRPLIRTTTGACTRRNYSNTITGFKGDIHHVYGALYVEINNNQTQFWHLIANSKSGTFHWLDQKIENGIITKNTAPEAIVLGDLHSHSADPETLQKTIALISKLKPKTIVIHDAFDGNSISHHKRRNVLEAMELRKENHNSAAHKEIKTTYQTLKKLQNINNARILVTAANHDEWLKQYLENDWRTMPLAESIFYLDLASKATQHLNQGKRASDFNALQAMMPENKNITYLGRKDSVKIKNIEIAIHGDKAAGGGRGSISAIAKYANKAIIGHSHSPAIIGGCTQVGTMTPLSMPYCQGYSRWDQAHCLIYANGKRTLHFMR